MIDHVSRARWMVVVLVACGLGGCSGSVDPLSTGVTVNPPSVTLVPAEQQNFFATPPTVTWQVREGDAGGTISATGLYTAPGTPGTYTVVATEPDSGASAEATVTVISGTGALTHGLSIPTTHPVLWYDAARLAAARAWYATHPFTPSDVSIDTLAIERAARGLLNSQNPADQQTQCRAALDWALAETAGMAANVNAGSSQWNAARWNGEAIILAYDWCNAYLTPTERSTFIANTNVWMEARRTQVWGDVPMYLNNYYWGFTRNQLEWAMTSYHHNTAAAEVFLDDALVRRIQNDFNVGALNESRGGIFQEGSQYGPYVANYATVPYVSAGLLGRSLLSETNFWKEAIYGFIYSTTPGETVGLGHVFFPHCDSGNGVGSSVVGRDSGNFMTAAAMRWPDVAVGQHARQWLSTTGAPRARHVESVDPGGAGLAFTGLPLDYYASGARYLYGRTAWAPTATALFLQLGDRDYEHIGGHTHVDWGTWQIWRNGRFLSRETAVYSHTIAGYANGPAVAGSTAIGHNSVLVNGAGSAVNGWGQYGVVDVPRLEVQPGYLFAVADLSPTADNPGYGNAAFVNWVREFVFVRGLETLVILDRLQSAGASDTKTFLAHCETSPAVAGPSATCTVGTQSLVMTTLVPAAPTYRVVAEGGIGQYRIEVDTTPGTAQSYIITVLQAKDSGAAALSPSVVDDGPSYTVSLNGSTHITFAKGMASTGGAITLGGTTTSFRNDVQLMTVTDGGPVWQ